MLIVEDDAAVHDMLLRLLEVHGFRTVGATMVAQAQAIAATEPIDAVILDLVLSHHENGVDFLEWLRQHAQYSRTPVCVLTGLMTVPEEDELRIRAAGAEVFHKPGALDALVSYLRNVTADRRG